MSGMQFENGKYKHPDGRTFTPAEMVDLHKTAPRSESIVRPKRPLDDLKEGQSSGPIRLQD